MTGTNKPPVLATRLLVSFLKPGLVEEVSGDLDEKFRADLRRTSRFRACAYYWLQVIQYLRPFAIRGIEMGNIISISMFTNYWKITWRVMARQKLYAAINVGGFAIGIAACLLITLYIRHELSFDKHYENSERIFRIYRESTFNGEFRANAWMPAPLADALKSFPAIEQSGHYVGAGGLVDGRTEIKRADKNENFFEDEIVYASQGLIGVLQLPFISGNSSTALTQQRTVVITKRKADKYFPGEDPLGKLIVLNHDDKNPFTITGVIANYPDNTHFRADFILSDENHEFWPGEQLSWGSSNYFDYVQLRQGSDPIAIGEQLHSLVDDYFVPDAIKNGNDASVNWAKSLNFKLQPVTDIHFNRVHVGDPLTHNDIQYIWLFISVAFFIIVIASINFVNLSTARSTNRAKEVGLRKVVGSARGALIKQFLMESIVYCMVAFVIGCAIAYFLLPVFNNIVGTSLRFSADGFTFFPLVFGTALCIGLLAGIYPAFYLSAFQPAQILKGTVTRGTRQTSLRSLLVVCQYTLSIALIIGTLVIRRQMSYMLNKPLGFDKEQALVLQSTHTLGDKMPSFKNELENIRGVQHVSVSGFLPVAGTRRNGSGMWKDVVGQTADGVDVQQWTVDSDYITTLGLKLIEGRNFSPGRASDSAAVIVTRKLIKSMGIENAIGQVIVNPWRSFNIIGVVEDFHFESMRQDIAPVALVLGKNEAAVTVRLSTTDVSASVEQISSLWKSYVPGQPMRYAFLDERFASMYADVKLVGTIMTSFSALAIIIASLGLFALSSFTVEQRAKEISIRMVLGATTAGIVKLITGNFIKLVGLSFLLAAPLAWLVMNRWLQDYAYRVSWQWDVFGFAAAMAFSIALCTIVFQALRAALGNPSRNLRSE